MSPKTAKPTKTARPQKTSSAAKSSRIAAAEWEALGTSAVLRLTEPSALAHARVIVERELDAIDRTCSRFRADSDISRVNAAAGRRTTVDPLLVEALLVALRAAELTGGDVDPTVGTALELAGYDRDWRLLEEPPRGEPAEVRAGLPAVRVRRRPGWQALEVDVMRSAIRVPAGVHLDLGATAKAWAADRAAHAVHEATGAGVLVGLGGDLATSGVAPAGGWRVRVTDDHRSGAGAPGQTISIASGGLATSSTAVRRWSHDGRTMHHIIDPGTGAPVAGTWRTASVAAADCLDANIASTAALVRGEAAPEWLSAIGLPARLVDQMGRVQTLGEWPAATGAPR